MMMTAVILVSYFNLLLLVFVLGGYYLLEGAVNNFLAFRYHIYVLSASALALCNFISFSEKG